MLWFWGIWDIAFSRFKSPVMGSVWLLVVFVFNVLGVFFYFLFKSKFVYASRRKFQPDFNRIERNS
jgi:hypothetical protein